MKTEVVSHPKKLLGLRVVQDIDEVIEALKKGETIARYEFGDSMSPILVSGQYARLSPLNSIPQVGDAVFCKVNGYWMTHMVIISNQATGYCLIGSSQYDLYGWTNEILALATPINFIENEKKIN